MTGARLLVGDVHDRTAQPADRLDCGHPDDTPDVAHNDRDQQVCADCCPTCSPKETA